MADIGLLIENQQLIASGLASGAVNTLSKLLGINVPFTPALGPPGEPNIVPPDLEQLDVPIFQGRDITLPPSPVSDPLTKIAIPTLPDFPADTTPPQPAFVMPPTPSQIAEFNGGPPPAVHIPDDIADLNVDAMLAAITAPTLTAINIKAAPTISLPEFNAVRPGSPPAAPNDLDEEYNEAYQQALNIANNSLISVTDAWFDRFFPNHANQIAALEARLDTYLAGGSAVDVNVASAIFEIERGKRDAEYRRLERSMVADAGKRGFDIPDGVFLAAKQDARTALADANALTAADIRKMQFDLEQKNLQFAVTESRAWRSVAVQAYQSMFNSFTTINGQSIDYAKSFVQTLVEIYNASLNGFRAAVELYQADAAVYGERLKAALAPLELYKSELEAEKLKEEINEAQIRLYEQQLHAVEIVAAVYRARIDALIARGNLEKLKVELYGAIVQAYAALVSAKEAEYRGYEAQVSGQVALQQAWGEALRARTAQLEGYKAHVEALNEQLRTATAYNDGVLRKLEAATRVYEAEVSVQKTLVDSDVQQYSAEVEGIARTNEGKGKIASLKVEEWRTSRELLLKKSEQEVTRATAEANVMLQSIGLNVKVAEAIGSNYASMASAALSGINGVLSSAESHEL